MLSPSNKVATRVLIAVSLIAGTSFLCLSVAEAGWGRGPSWKQARKDGGNVIREGGKGGRTVLREGGKVATGLWNGAMGAAAGSRGARGRDEDVTDETSTGKELPNGKKATVTMPGPDQPVDGGSQGRVTYFDFDRPISPRTYGPIVE
ncbi:hypothetical protein SG09_38270 [Bradyrhizobium ottawaense]|uniref:hypothetical protein n=1 Tax=Bradyrhizobium ottawaense TaxID=931866 RepID=UPI00126104D2|nr:hypothetical protein [Bradyrhizobium ottawaense]BBO04477.1 hypothetical protein SG09_38270 [Bradyrhizobium ottawaense]